MDGGHATDLFGRGKKRDNHYMVIAIAMPGAFPLLGIKQRQVQDPHV